MWPTGNGYFTARYWATDYWFTPLVAAFQRFIGSVRGPGNTGTVQAAADVE